MSRDDGFAATASVTKALNETPLDDVIDPNESSTALRDKLADQGLGISHEASPYDCSMYATREECGRREVWDRVKNGQSIDDVINNIGNRGGI